MQYKGNIKKQYTKNIISKCWITNIGFMIVVRNVNNIIYPAKERSNISTRMHIINLFCQIHSKHAYPFRIL